MNRRFFGCLARTLAMSLAALGMPRAEAQEGGPLGPVGAFAEYRHAAGTELRANVVERFSLRLGAAETHHDRLGQWLEVAAVKANGQRFAVRVLADAFPPPPGGRSETAAGILRYVLEEDGKPALEYAHKYTDMAVLPALGAGAHLWPQPVEGSFEYGAAAPRTAWLGHTYELLETSGSGDGPGFNGAGAKRVALLPEVLIGVPHNVRTVDDTRRYDNSDYDMARMTREDLATMIEVGMNCLRLDAEQAEWLRAEPVFYWGPGGGDIAFPECLFRSTYLGPTLFYDEPMVVTRDYVIRPRLSDPEYRQALTPAVALDAFKQHFREKVETTPTAFIRQMRARDDVDLGGMDFVQRTLYTWETMTASGVYQLTAHADEGGPRAIVFEPPGRFGTRHVLPLMNMAYGCQIPADNPAHLADIIIGFLRGAARASGKEWGLSIYGAVDRADAPLFLTRAYDMGATHFFYWDNYQLATVPFGEYVAHSRHLTAHAQARPDRRLERLKHAAEIALLLPPGYNLGHVHMGRGNLWGLGELNLERVNEHGVTYREIMGNFFTEIERCIRHGIIFDLLWDVEDLDLDGYREVVRVREDGRVDVIAYGQTEERRTVRVPERPGGMPPQLAVELSGAKGPLPRGMTARAIVSEGAAPVYYTTGTDRTGIYQNDTVLWELYGPTELDYSLLSSGAGTRTDDWTVVETEFTVREPGRYRLRTAICDVAGRTAVSWTEFDIVD